MKKRGFLNLCMVAALATITAGSLYSCKDYDDEIFAELGKVQGSNSTLDDKLDQQETTLGKVQEALTDSVTAINKQAAADKQALEQKIEAAEKTSGAQHEVLKKEITADSLRLEALIKRVEILEAHSEEVDKALAEVDKALAELDKNKADKSAVENLLTQITEVDKTLQKFQNSVNDSIIKLQKEDEKMNQLLADIQETLNNRVTSEEFNALSDKVVGMESQLNALKVSLDSKADTAEVNKLNKDIEGLTTKLQEQETELKELLEAEISKATKTLDEKFEGKFNALDLKVGVVRKEFEAADKLLQDQITALRTDVDKLLEEVKKISVLQDVVDNMITSLLLNGAKSPVVGYFALPTGLKSNILAAYYGFAETNEIYGFNFPAEDLTDFVGAAKNSAIHYASGDTILADGFNAGKVYLTVNPSSAYMANKTFSLINSRGDLAPLVFDTARLSEDKLTFGFSRAGQNKNFYEVKARLNGNQIANAKLRMEISEMKEALGMVKNAILNDASLDVTQLASAIFKCVNDIADANAVKVSWETTDAAGKSVQHDVTSDYGLAAVAVKPLSYDFMKDYEIKNFWGIDKAYSLLDKIIGQANKITSQIVNQFPEFNLDVPKIDTIKIESLDEDLLAQFKIVYNETFKENIVIDDSVVIDQVIKLDSVKVPDMDVLVPGDTIQVPIKVTQPITVKIPSKRIPVVNPAKIKPDEPGYDEAIHKDMADSIYVEIPEDSITQNIVIDKMQEVVIDGTKVKVDGPYVKLEDVKIHVSQPVHFEKEIKVPVNFEKDMSGAVEELYGSMTGSIQDVNSMLKDLQKFINVDLNNLLKEMNGMKGNIQQNLDEAIESLEQDLTKLINKVNNGLCKIVNNVNEALQPVMFAQAGDFVMVSRAQNAPSEFSNGFVLVPSSYSAEFLAPAAQKYVAVTNVIAGDKDAKNDSKCKDVLDATNKNNADLNKVLEGGNHAVKVENLASGYTYEFTYSAVDYYGKVRNIKCYVAVK